MKKHSLRQQSRSATLRAGGASEILAVLEDFGVDPAEPLADAGLAADSFDDPGNVITYAARGRLMKYCAARTGCQHFGLLVGQRMNLHNLGLLGSLMKTSRDVGTALRSLVRLLHLHSQGAAMALTVDDELAVLTYDAFESRQEGTDQTGDGAVAMMLNVLRTLCGHDFKPIEATFAHRRPADIKPFREFFRIPLYFDTNHYALVFSPVWLDARPPGADTQLQRLLQGAITAHNAKHSLKFPEQVRSVLRSAVTTDHCTEERIALLFSMSSRTLSRRLDASGTSFHELVDECRFDIARQMLRNTALRVSEIGTSVGYSRSSAFIRAFRRWSGSTPSQWRAASDAIGHKQ